MSSCSINDNRRVDSNILSKGFVEFSKTFKNNPNDLHHSIVSGYKVIKDTIRESGSESTLEYTEWVDFLRKSMLVTQAQGERSKKMGESIRRESQKVADKYGVKIDPKDNPATTKAKINAARRSSKVTAEHLIESAELINTVLSDRTEGRSDDFGILTTQQAIQESYKSKNKLRSVSSVNMLGVFDKMVVKTKKGQAQLDKLKELVIDPVNEVELTLKVLNGSYRKGLKAISEGKKLFYTKLANTKSIEGYTKDESLQLYLAHKRGDAVNTGITDEVIQKNVDYVKNDSELLNIAEQLFDLTGDDWIPISENWKDFTIRASISNYIRTEKRKMLLENNGWMETKDVIFTPDLYNKIRASFKNGKKVADVLQRNIKSMETGSTFEPDGEAGAWLVKAQAHFAALPIQGNPEIGVKQLSSFINFVEADPTAPNFIINATLAVGTKEWRAQVLNILRSDWAKDRFSSKAFDNEIALLGGKEGMDRAGALELLEKLRQLAIAGNFSLVSVGDLGASVLGGPSYIVNYKKKFLKEINPETGDLYSDTEAQAKAFEAFIENAESSQQSKLATQRSADQRTIWGKLIFTFTTFQHQANWKATQAYNNAVREGNGSFLNAPRNIQIKTIGNILFYRAISPMIFDLMTQAVLNTILTDDENEEEEWAKQMGISVLEFNALGRGKWGKIAVIMTKVINKIYKETQDPGRDSVRNVLSEALGISPGLSILEKMERRLEWEFSRKDVDEVEVGRILGEGVTGVSTRNWKNYIKSMQHMAREQVEAITKLHLYLGWSLYDLGIEDRTKSKRRKKSSGKGSKK